MVANATYWDLDNTHAGSLYRSLMQKLEHYEFLLNQAQEVVKRTESKFRQVDNKGLDAFLEKTGIHLFELNDVVRLFGKHNPETGKKLDLLDRLDAFNSVSSIINPAALITQTEWGKELLGVNDAIRMFASHDPVTEKKLDTSDHIIGLGWTLLNITPAKFVGVVGKVAIKGGRILFMSEKATKTLSGMRNVLRNSVIRQMMENAWPTVKNLKVFPKEVRLLRTADGGIPLLHIESHTVDDILSVITRDKSVAGSGLDNAKEINDLTKITVDDIPTAKSGNFNNFFNSLTSRELDELWKDKKIRKKIERQLREPGGLHEWHLVSRAPQFKHWNISAEEIKNLRTAISDVKFVNPSGTHGGLGSTKAHNELLAIIDSSGDYNTFVRRLNNWANYRLEGGNSSLPDGLRLK